VLELKYEYVRRIAGSAATFEFALRCSGPVRSKTGSTSFAAQALRAIGSPSGPITETRLR